MMMENGLQEAAFEGNVSKLNELIKQDPLILDRIISPTNFFLDTPLHISILRGHLEFARAVLSHNPRLATESDSLGHSPLHVASAKGHLEMVRELVRVSQATCLTRSKDGNKLPLHLAIMKGVRVEVVAELARACPESTRVLVDRGDSVLHLCVRYENLDAFHVLMQVLKGTNLLNARNDDGNTVLHLVALYKHFQITKHLLSTPGIEPNAVNNNGLTALDLVENSPKDLKSLELLAFLLQSNVQNSSINNNKTQPSKSLTTQQKPIEPNTQSKSWKSFFTINGVTKQLEDIKGAIFIVAAIIALIDALPIIYLSVNGPEIPDQFWMNSASFVPAVTVILLLISGFPLSNRFCAWIVIQLMYTALGFMGLNYFAQMAWNENRYSKWYFAVYFTMIWFFLLIILSGINVIRLIVLVVSSIQGIVMRRKLRNRSEMNEGGLLTA